MVKVSALMPPSLPKSLEAGQIFVDEKGGVLIILRYRDNLLGIRSPYSGGRSLLLEDNLFLIDGMDMSDLVKCGWTYAGKHSTVELA